MFHSWIILLDLMSEDQECFLGALFAEIAFESRELFTLKAMKFLLSRVKCVKSQKLKLKTTSLCKAPQRLSSRTISKLHLDMIVKRQNKASLACLFSHEAVHVLWYFSLLYQGINYTLRIPPQKAINLSDSEYNDLLLPKPDACWQTTKVNTDEAITGG